MPRLAVAQRSDTASHHRHVPGKRRSQVGQEVGRIFPAGETTPASIDRSRWVPFFKIYCGFFSQSRRSDSTRPLNSPSCSNRRAFTLPRTPPKVERVKEDPEARRQWKTFQMISTLPERDQKAVARLINSLVAAGASRQTAL